MLGSSGTRPTVPLQRHPKQCVDEHLRPRRPGATSSLLSCCPNRPINRVSLAMLDFQIQKTPLTIRHERAQSERTNLTTELQRGCNASAERMPSRDRAAVIKTI